jgi:hypothetical protein
MVGQSSEGGLTFTQYATVLDYMTDNKLSRLTWIPQLPKPQGLPPERLALGLVFESIFGYTVGIRAVDAVSRTDFGLLAGLPFLPSPSTQYRFL